MSPTTLLLSARALVKHYRARGQTVLAVDGVDLDIHAGEIVGLVGESGCGKSTLGRTLVRLQDVTSGSIRFEGTEISALPRRALKPVRRRLQIIFQDPMSSLNPRSTVGRILEEPLIVHGIGTRHERAAAVREMLDKVGLPRDAVRRSPHEFSGGQRQRIGIARALLLRPALVVCDEPVAALDVSVRAQVINLLLDLKDAYGLAYLFISHDMSLVEYIADRIAVMYLGRIVEFGPRNRLWSAPAHPYTRALISAIPIPDPKRRGGTISIQGEPPSPVKPPPGCRFRLRCLEATERCTAEEPAFRRIADGHFVACHFA